MSLEEARYLEKVNERSFVNLVARQAAVAYVEGQQYRTNEDGKVYLALDRKLRWIPNPSTYAALFATELTNPASYKSISVSDLCKNGLSVGPQLLDGAQLIRDPNGGAIYLTDDNTHCNPSTANRKKRWIINPDVYNLYKFNWNKWVNWDASALSAVPTGSDITGLQ